MPNLSRTQIIGHVGQEPELRLTPSGKSVATFTVAENHKYQKDNEWQEDTQWYTVYVWGRLAEVCNQRVKKGALVYVEGRTKLHQWETKEGKQGARLELTANRVLFLSGQATNNEEVESDNPF